MTLTCPSCDFLQVSRGDKCQRVLILKSLLSILKLLISTFDKKTVKPVLSGHSKRTPKIGVQYRLSLNADQVLQNAPKGAFCNTFDLHLPTVCL